MRSLGLIEKPARYFLDRPLKINLFVFVKSGYVLILIYMLTAIGLTPGGSCTVHMYTQTIHRTTQLTTLVGRLSGIRTQSGQTKINDELTA